MSQAVSVSTGRRYGLVRVCGVWEIARSTVYAAKERRQDAKAPRRRGPKTKWSDEALLEKIREILASSPFVGEGHRKVWARLRSAGVRTSKGRALRLMRGAGLLSPARTAQAPEKTHDGTIITERPDEMWGTDGTSCPTDEGQATVFIAVDHCTAECVGIHAARPGTRFEALEPIRQGVREYFGSYEEGLAKGLAIRHDQGPQYTSDYFQAEIRFLGAEPSWAFVREPECNGCAERFIRTLKEQLLWLRRFATVEELRRALLDFRERYNHEWLIERHGHRSPAEVRASLEVAA